MEENKMEEVNKIKKHIDEEKIKNFCNDFIINNNLDKNVMLEIHFIGTLLNEISLEEIEEIKKYNIKDENAKVIIITCDDQNYIDEWLKENQIQDNMSIISDYNREISESFSILNNEIDLPSRLSCLLDPWRAKVFWVVIFSMAEKRNIEEISKFTLETLKKIDNVL